jgi:RNA polymerase sigma factor for flagellar operon FliA
MHTLSVSIPVDELQQTWDDYLQYRDVRSRNYLLLHYMSLVERVAGRLKASMPITDFDDLVSHGTIGLIRAIEKFDPTIGAKCEAYAAIRIHGAIIDELRVQDWIPRAVRTNNKQYSAGMKTVSQEMSARFRAKNFIPRIEALDYQVGTGGACISDLIVDRRSHPEQELLIEEMFAIMSVAIGLTSEHLQRVAEMYYGDSMNMGHVANVIGVTPMRVSQMLKQFNEQLVECIGMGR